MDWVIDEARGRATARQIAYLNAATTNLAIEDKDFAETLRSFDCLYADGKAVVWASKFLGNPIPERVNAGDFIEEFFRRCASENLKIGLVGGKAGEAKGFADHFLNRIPNLTFVFLHTGYFESSESKRITEEIEKINPDIVLVGMGSPRQEEHAIEWNARGKPRVWWCVGALFEYWSGTRKRAPVWMRRVGLEWLFRLALEPGRLWKRYLIGNPKFIWRVWRSKRN